jgi:hypothetical protein
LPFVTTPPVNVSVTVADVVYIANVFEFPDGSDIAIGRRLTVTGAVELTPAYVGPDDKVTE